MNPMTSSDNGIEPYTSLDALRQANDDLLATLPDDEAASPRRQPENRSEIVHFLDRAAATGTVLDAPSDRRAAQGLIDYWASNFPTLTRGGTMSGQSALTLKAFDAKTIEEVATRADALVTPQNEKLVRAVMLAFFKIGEGSPRCTSSPVELERLMKVGDSKKVKEVVDQLEAAGVLRISKGPVGDQAELRYEALTRKWPHLRNWLDQRIKFSEAAQFWLRSGKKHGALLTSGLWNDAKDYGNQNDTERDFVEASRRRDHFLRYGSIAAAIILVAVPLGISQIYGVYERRQVDADRELLNARAEQANTALKADQPRASKIAALEFLLKNRRPVDFTGGKLERAADPTRDRANVDDVESTGSRFIGARLYDFNVTRSRLPYTVFSQATLVNGTFSDTELELARFDGAVLENVSYSKTKLYRAIFDRALFCAGVKFTITDVRSASFRGVTFAGDEAPQFVGTAWWLAVGWSMDQIKKLADKSREVDFQQTDAFKDEFEKNKKELAEAREPIARASLLNGKAWHLATYGVNLTEAEASAAEALAIIRSQRGADSSKYQEEEGSYLDTLAYVLMQQPGKMPQALGLLKEATEKTASPDVIFRYAVAQFVEGQREEGLKILTLALDEKKYVPSHELYLLWPHVSVDAFRLPLEELMNKDDLKVQRAATECPSQVPSSR